MGFLDKLRKGATKAVDEHGAGGCVRRGVRYRAPFDVRNDSGIVVQSATK